MTTRIESYEDLTERIVRWLKDYYYEHSIDAFVIGVSGGIDSAVVSTLCAETGLPTYVLGMPIHQKEDQENLSDTHLDWLERKYPNVTRLKYDLSNTFDTLQRMCIRPKINVWMCIRPKIFFRRFPSDDTERYNRDTFFLLI